MISNSRTSSSEQSARRVDAVRLWVGGLVGATVAAGIVIVGILAAGILHTRVFDEDPTTNFLRVSTSWYAFGAAVVALAATALLQLLLVIAPRPRFLFRAIMTVVTMIAIVTPFSHPAALASQVTLATINLVVGVAILSLNGGFVRDVVRTATPEDVDDVGRER